MRARPLTPLFGKLVLPLTLLLTPAAPPSARAQAPAAPDEGLTRLLRQPDIQGDTVVFVYAGDLWVVGADGGTARRLTSDPGLELFPKLSPDGRWVAFSAEYSGNRQVWVIPVEGGAPRQLTFYNDVGELPPRGGVDYQVADWTPDGESIVFLAHRLPWGERMEIPYTVPFAGGMEKPLGPPEGTGVSMSPDGTRVVYTPIGREFRTWKRYHGGRAQDVWTFDLAKVEAKQLTDYDGTDNQPTWVGDTIYFTSDRTGTLELWALAADGAGDARPRQVTHHGDASPAWDVLWPSAGSERIVYEAGGYVWRFDPPTERSTRLPIRVSGDFRATLPHIEQVSDDVATYEVSPSGARGLFEAHGDLFTVPAEKGEVRNLTRTPGVRERDPMWSPDGRRVAYWSDATGEYELYVRPADGSGEPRQVSHFGDDPPVWRFTPRWSPDSKRLAFGDHQARLMVIDAASGAVTEVDRDRFNDVTDYRWSPDGRWLAYTKTAATRLASVWVWSADAGETYRLTSDETQESEPTWDPEGRYLYFLSNRDFQPTFSGFEFDFVYTDPTRVYVGLLAKDGPALLLPESDEEKVEAEEAEAGGEAGKKGGEGTEGAKKADEQGSGGSKAAAAVTVKLDPEGFEDRVRAIPGDPGDYRGLSATAAGPLYLTGDAPETELHLYDLEAREEKTVLSGILGYELAAGGEKILFRAPGEAAGAYGIADAEPDQKAGEGRLDLGGMEMRIDPPAEWHEEFVDAWRIFRDWFYDPNMHGLDWRAMRAEYEPLVAHVAHRADLDYVLGELGGELGSGHVYVQTAPGWQKERRESGLLGAEIVRDDSGYYRVAHVFPGENWHEDFRSPLTEPGIDVSEGDLILAVDGVSTQGVDNFYRLLEGKADRVVTLSVAATPPGRGGKPHDERVEPVRTETNLRYLDWVASRRRYVTEASGGRIGYIHLPNTALEGNRELYKGFYGQARKDALILDDRYNGGGFIPFQMVQLLERPVLSFWAQRNVEPFSTPGFFHRGPKAALINGYSSSGGDAFPYYFRQQGLGPLIGTRTWGGLIGLSGNPQLMDGGAVLVPTFRFFEPGGTWAIEGVGVEPDVEVVDRPDLVARGQDPTLEKAVQVLLDELAKNPPPKIVVPTPPAQQRP